LQLGAGFAYDLSAILSKSPGTHAYYLINGLSYGRRMAEIVSLDARIARQDQQQQQAHQGLFLYSAALTVNEWPTLGHSLVYSGQVSESGAATINSLSLYNRATPYRGIGLLAGGSVNYTAQPSGQTTRNDIVTVSATIQPHRAVTVTSGYAYSATRPISGGGSSSLNNRLEGTVTFAPVPALFVSGGLSHVIVDRQSYTLANGAATVSPFREGALQFSLNVSQTLEPGGQVSKVFSAVARWYIHRATTLTAAYTVAGQGPGGTVNSIDVNLRIPL